MIKSVYKMSDRHHLRSPSPPALTSEERDEPAPELDPSTYSPTLPTSRPGNSEELNLLRCQIKLLERMVFRNQNTSTHKLSEIYLPNYDPDEHKITIEECCNQVTFLITMRGCSVCCYDEGISMLARTRQAMGRH